jgi:predicted TPR repeat methyltransferase
MSPVVKSAVALDNSEKMTAMVRKKHLPNVAALTGALTKDFIASHTLLQQGFDLVVASSVCAFLDNYSETLQLLKAVLNLKGLFIQWDWMKSGNEPGFGFSMDEIEAAIKGSGLGLVSVSEAFALEGEHGTMKVLMGIGKKNT